MAATTLNELLRDAAPQLVKLFMPAIFEELRRNPEFAPRQLFSNDYDPRTCDVFVAELSNDVLKRAERFFTVLERVGKIDSVALAKLLGVKSPRSLPGTLTTGLKTRARSLGLERPWDEPSGQLRTTWTDRNGISLRMLEAIQAERGKRGI